MKNLLCFSHLNWEFVYQRPQHLLSRFAKIYKLYYFEEPRPHSCDDIHKVMKGNICIVKILFDERRGFNTQLIYNLLKDFLRENDINFYDCWYYTPMALEYTRELNPDITIFDSMDELSAFRFAPPRLLELEEELFRYADVVFTGGNSLFQAKKHRHHNIHCFPSSIDMDHFAKAKHPCEEPPDQQHIPHPRFGFYGVIDERFDIELLKEVSHRRPDWHFIIIGPIVKINEEELPRAENIHYLGGKSYGDLPNYIAHWDIALILFALNESTRFISPTKTPEYLAAGLPVISTPITDVVNPYGNENLVSISYDCHQFIEHGERLLNLKNNNEWEKQVEKFLGSMSWDKTFEKMNLEICKLSKIKS